MDQAEGSSSTEDVLQLRTARSIARLLVRSLSLQPHAADELLHASRAAERVRLKRRQSSHASLAATVEEPASPPAATNARQRAASLISFRSARSTDSAAPSLPSKSTQPSVRHHIHEHKANEARWARERDISASLVQQARAVISTGDHQVLYCSKASGPAFDFDWDVDMAQGGPAAASSRVILDIWGLSASSRYSDEGKGKAKAEQQESWKRVVSWEVDLSQLVPLGRKASEFPTFPANTIVVQFKDGEYFTAPTTSTAPTFLEPAQEEPFPEGEAEGPPDPLAAERQLLTARKQFVRDRRVSYVHRATALERSVRETKMALSVRLDDCFALVATQNEVLAERDRLELVRAELYGRVGQEAFASKRDVGRRKLAVSMLNEDVKRVQTRNDEARTILSSKRGELLRRRDRLKAAQAWLDDRVASAEPYDLLSAERSACADLQAELKEARAKLALLLESIFPIDDSSASSPLDFTICQLHLPNSEFPASASIAEEEEASSALGLTAQLVNILAAYLGVALYYPITPAGSRSFIADFISTIKGIRTFPLYATGVERYRFEYAVFLLNKDIEQLLHAERILMIDLRHTLPNLKNLLLHVGTRTAHHFTAPEPHAKANGDLSVDLADASQSATVAAEAEAEASSTSSSRSSSPAPTIKGAATRRNSVHLEKRVHTGSDRKLRVVIHGKEGAHMAGPMSPPTIVLST